MKIFPSSRVSKCGLFAVLMPLLMTACEREAEECIASPPDDPAALPTRTLEIGDVELGKFKAWQPGEQVEVELGSQGFEMITPYVELPTGAGDPDSACWCLQTYTLEAGAPPLEPSANDYCQAFVFESVKGRMRVGPIFALLEGDEPRGEPIQFQVLVSSSTFTASKVIEIVLE